MSWTPKKSIKKGPNWLNDTMLLSASWVTTPIVSEVQKVSGKADAQQNNVSATTLCYSTPAIATPGLDRLDLGGTQVDPDHVVSHVCKTRRGDGTCVSKPENAN